MAIACVIPARLASSRFPGKMLRSLEGIPIVLHTLRRAREAGCFAELLCFTDAEEIRAVAESGGFRAVMTGPAANGTDRIAGNLEAVSADLIVNLQGDEPAFPVEALRLLARALEADPSRVHVLVREGEPGGAEMANPNRVKAGLDEDGCVLDFYRALPRRPVVSSRMQMGAYGYGKAFLRKYAAAAPSPREIAESHELLRNLELAPIRAHACRESSQAVDVPEDLEAAGNLLRSRWADGDRIDIMDPIGKNRG